MGEKKCSWFSFRTLDLFSIELETHSKIDIYLYQLNVPGQNLKLSAAINLLRKVVDVEGKMIFPHLSWNSKHLSRGVVLT